MEKERACDICFVLGCVRCAKKWDINLRQTAPSLKYLQGFFETHCANCGSDNRAIEIIKVNSI